MALATYQIWLESMYEKMVCARLFSVSAFGAKNYRIAG